MPDADLYHGGWASSASSSDPPPGSPEAIKREEGGGRAAAVKEPEERKVQVKQDLSVLRESQKQHDPKTHPAPLYQLYPSLCGERIVQERSDMRRFQPFKDFPGQSLALLLSLVSFCYGVCSFRGLFFSSAGERHNISSLSERLGAGRKDALVAYTFRLCLLMDRTREDTRNCGALVDSV